MQYRYEFISTRHILIYSARFQIEYLFRDGKSHMGLGDAQVRKSCGLNFQNNACLTALNLLKFNSVATSTSL